MADAKVTEPAGRLADAVNWLDRHAVTSRAIATARGEHPEVVRTQTMSADALEFAAAYIRRANAVLGEECACGHFLKAEHGRSYNPERNAVRTYCKVDGCECEIWPGNQIESALLTTAAGATENERREG